MAEEYVPNYMEEEYVLKEQEKTPEEQLRDVEIGNLPEKEFRVMTVKMIQEILEKEWRKQKKRLTRT